MEIVRQRKKRLLAWILTLVLCVGMWQGNVKAEGDEVPSTEAMSTEEPPAEMPPTETELTEGGGEIVDPVDTSETGDEDMPVVERMYVILQNSNSEPVKVTSDNIFNIDDMRGKYVQSEDSIKYYFDSFTQGNGIYINGLYRHRVIEWGEAVSGECTATIGKSVVINWTEENSSDSLADAVSVAEGDSNTTVKLPVAGNKNGFIKQWTIEGKTIDKSEQSYQVDFEAITDFEKNIQAIATLSKQIENEGGTFYLSENVDYMFSKGLWKVNGGTDGYTYGNDDGNITFYVPSEGEYSFSK